MPELPEVETIKRFLAPRLKGKKISRVKILSAKQFPQRPDLLVGRKIKKIKRYGKMLLFVLDQQLAMLFHLKLTGQVFLVSADQPPQKSTRVIIYFTDQTALFFNDRRKFGWIKVGSLAQLKREWQNLGCEPLKKDFTPAKLGQILASSQRAVKLVLMDQEKIAGIGNIYANEILFAAGISPWRPAKSLNQQEIKKLYRAVREILKKGIAFGGTSAADEAYLRPDGQPDRFQQRLKVYQRAGQKCFRCGGIIQREDLGGRGTFFCPSCQK